MKFFKRLAPIVLVLILVLAMVPTGAFACYPCTTFTVQMMDTGTPSKAITNAQYSAYQIVSWGFNYDGSTEKVTSYKDITIKADSYRSAIAAADGVSATGYTDTQLVAMMKTITSAEASAALAASLKLATATGPAPVVSNANGYFSDIKPGYYLILQTSGSGKSLAKPILAAFPTIGSAANACTDTIVVKTSTVNIEKKIVIGSALYDSSTAAVGDTVNYQSRSTFPTYAANATNIVYYVTDTFSAGLTPNFDIVAKIVSSSGAVVKTLAATTDYVLSTTGSNFKLELINQDDIKTWGNAGNQLLLTYSANINASASFGSTGNPNSIYLTYGNEPDDHTQDDTVITYLIKLVVVKNDNSTPAVPLKGATFTLSKKDSGTATYTVIETQTTGDDGKAVFTKLSQGDYRLTETVAPVGYKMLTETTDFTITAKNTVSPTLYLIPDTRITQPYSGNSAALAYLATWISSNSKVVVGADGNLTATVVNEPDFHLPGTGGIGTTIFTVGGVLILLLASVLFVVYNKKRREGENH